MRRFKACPVQGSRGIDGDVDSVDRQYRILSVPKEGSVFVYSNQYYVVSFPSSPSIVPIFTSVDSKPLESHSSTIGAGSKHGLGSDLSRCFQLGGHLVIQSMKYTMSGLEREQCTVCPSNKISFLDKCKRSLQLDGVEGWVLKLISLLKTCD